MIKSFHLANFQSHKESHLDFAPGLNVILGQSDAGKTSILRALHWVYSNRPSGEAFRSSWGGDTGAGVDLEEVDVSRLRTKTLNTYTLGNDGFRKNCQVFKALGKGVPEEVVKALNMIDLNWQMQFDPFFLLSLSPGEVARRLNEIVKLDVIDLTISNLNSSIRQNNQAVQTTEQTVKDQKEELADFDYLEQMEDDVAKVEAKEQKWLDLSEEYEQIEDKLSRIGLLAAQLGEAKEVLKMEEQVNELFTLTEQLEVQNACQRSLGLCVDAVQQKEKEILLAAEEQDELQQEFTRLMPSTCPLCNQEVK